MYEIIDEVRRFYQEVGEAFLLPKPEECLMYAITEMGEVADAVLREQRPHDSRRRTDKSSVKEEMGDVALMLCASLNAVDYRKYIAELENAIREAALKEYAENGNKRPHSAIAVRINKRLRYDVNAALEYCRKHFDAAVEVVLNTKVFEKAAPNLDLDFVQVVEEPQATIASDLTPYLPAE